MAKIGDQPTGIDGVKSARNQCRNHDEGGAVIIVCVACDNDLRAGKPCCVRCERTIGVLEELKFIPRFAEVGKREQAGHQNDDQQGNDGKLFRANKSFHFLVNLTSSMVPRGFRRPNHTSLADLPWIYFSYIREQRSVSLHGKNHFCILAICKVQVQISACGGKDIVGLFLRYAQSVGDIQ